MRRSLGKTSGRRTAVPAVPAALALVLLAAGCDDGGNRGDDYIAVDEPVASEADTLAITEVATKVIAGKEPGHICNVLLSRELVEEFYATRPTCRRLLAARPGDTATAVVDAVDVEGARGSAIVTGQGGAADGATGSWNFVRTPKGWQVEDWGVDYVRSIVVALFGPRYRPSGAADPLGEQEVRVCVNGQFQDKDEDTFLADAMTYLRGGKPAEKLLAKAIAACRVG
jgi:hypothetical protein